MFVIDSHGAAELASYLCCRVLQIIVGNNGQRFAFRQGQPTSSEIMLHMLVQSLSPANLLKLLTAALLEHK